jgi:hypothetical protein
VIGTDQSGKSMTAAHDMEKGPHIKSPSLMENPIEQTENIKRAAAKSWRLKEREGEREISPVSDLCQLIG